MDVVYCPHKKKNGGNPMQLKFGENLRVLRQNAGITQDRLAEYLGITSQAVSRWESGVSHSKSNTMVTL